MIKALIFDYDGVICRTEEYFQQRKIEYINSLGYSVTMEDMFPYIGESFSTVFVRMFPEEKNADEIINYYYENLATCLPPYEEIFNKEIFEVLEYCKRKGIKVAIASNSKHYRLVGECENLHLLKYIDKLFSSELAGVAKPNPAFYELALKRLNVNSNEAIVIEDSKNGIMAAKKANIYTLAKKENVFHIDQSLADGQIDLLTEVIDVIENWPEQ